MSKTTEMHNKTVSGRICSVIMGTIILAVFLPVMAVSQQDQQVIADQLSGNREALRHYSWTKRTEVTLEGTQIRVKAEKMRYDLDGRLQVTPLGGSGQMNPEIQQLTDSLGELALSYAQPDPQKFRPFMLNASAWEGRGKNAGMLRMEGSGFLRPDDSVEIIARNQTADNATVRTMLDETPATIKAEYRALPNDGPIYVARLWAEIPSKNLKLTIENFDYVYNAPVSAGDILTLSEGTELQVRLTEPLSSAKNEAGQEFKAIVDKDVVVNGRTALARGSLIHGQIIDAEGSGRVSGRAKMSIALKQLVIGERQIPIETNTLSFEADGTVKRDAARTAGGAGLGAIIGAIAGGGKGAAIGAAIGGGAGVGATVITKGKEVEFDAETLFSFRLAKPLEIQR
jgi:hypothetical protein